MSTCIHSSFFKKSESFKVLFIVLYKFNGKLVVRSVFSKNFSTQLGPF